MSEVAGQGVEVGGVNVETSPLKRGVYLVNSRILL